MSLAIIPIKHLSKGKTRLSHRLEREELEQLCLAMLSDIVSALRQTPSIERVAVVTPDASVAEHASAAGAIALLRDDPGLNESIDAAVRELAKPGESTLVVLGDVAGALPEEIERLYQSLDSTEGPDPIAQVVLAPARDGGTAALLRAPADAIGSRFGPHSGREHRELAKRAGVSYRELSLASLSIDLDRPEDVDDFLEQASGGEQTRRIFETLGWHKGDRT
jgi:2-phospho-L-lactate guanylyltransferase